MLREGKTVHNLYFQIGFGTQLFCSRHVYAMSSPPWRVTFAENPLLRHLFWHTLAQRWPDKTDRRTTWCPVSTRCARTCRHTLPSFAASTLPSSAASSPLLLPQLRRLLAAMPSWNDGESSSQSGLGDALNCGFISWVDDQDWPDALQNALPKPWSMYDDANTCRIEERVENGKLLSQLAEEKTKAEKKYASLMADVGRFVDDSRKKVMEQNLALLNGKTELEVVEKEERDALKTAVDMLKHVQKTQADVMKTKEKKWEEERDALNAEKKKLEYMLYDLLKAGDDNKEKVKRIKAIVDE